MTEYKGFKIIPDGSMGYWTIRQPGSGAVPSALTGLYTTPAFAKVAIDSYEPKRGAKKKDGEAKTTAEL